MIKKITTDEFCKEITSKCVKAGCKVIEMQIEEAWFAIVSGYFEETIKREDLKYYSQTTEVLVTPEVNKNCIILEITYGSGVDYQRAEIIFEKIKETILEYFSQSSGKPGKKVELEALGILEIVDLNKQEFNLTVEDTGGDYLL